MQLSFRRSIALFLLSTWTFLQATAAQATPQLVFSVLPSSRSIDVSGVANAFVTVINSGTTIATDVRLSLETSVPAQFQFQTTDPTTNALTGSPNLPVDIAPGAFQTFVIGINPTGAIAPQEVRLRVSGSNTSATSTVIGVDTLFFSAANNPPDIVALSATSTGDGIASILNAGDATAFAVATFNVGAASTIVASVDKGGGNYPATLSICQTNPATSQCLSPPASSASSQMANSGTATFGVFIATTGPVPFDPANNRVFVRFRDTSGVVRGATSVAVRTTGAGQLQITAVSETGTVAPGVYKVLLNGTIVGETSASGQFTRTVPAVPTTVRLQRESLAGNASTNIPTNGVVQLSIPVLGLGSVDEVGLRILQSSNGVVPSSTTAFAIQVPGRLVARLIDVFLQSPRQDFVDRVTSMFSIGPNGVVQANNLADFKSLVGLRVATRGKLQIEVVGIDGNGLSFLATGEFNWGEATLTGRLRPPAATPSVPIANRTVSLTMGDRNVALGATTDGAGNFVINNVPKGTISLNATSVFNNITYIAEGAFTFNGPTTVELTFFSNAPGAVTDSPLKVLQRAPGEAFGPDQLVMRQNLDRRLAPQPPDAPAAAVVATGTSRDITVVAETTCSLQAVPTARTVAMSYSVSTAEYPTYVLQQSQYDDRWSVTATLPNGTTAFRTGLIGVNSQVNNQPIWQSNGSTGIISVPLAIPANVTSLKLRVTSVNIGDGALPTTVTADCPVAAELRFEKEMIEDTHKGTIRNISLPRPDANQNLDTNKRHALLKFTPADMQIDLASLRLIVKNESGVEFNVGPVQTELLAPGNIKMLTTFGFGNPNSPFSGLSGPNAKFVRYKVTANATVNGQSVTLAPAESKLLAPLWRSREVKEAVQGGGYGTLLPDHDDWSTSCTDAWLRANQSNLRAINDISAHHGRKPFTPHGSSHTRGRHIDIFHFYINANLASPTPGQSGSGGLYYTRLAEQAAIHANPASTTAQKAAALTVLRAWTQGTRTGADALFNAGGVGQIIYAIGSATGNAVAGWARDLVLDGRLPDGTLDQTLSSWNRSWYKTNAAHNDHVHIDLMLLQSNSQCDTSPG